MTNLITRAAIFLKHDRKGVTAMEYGLIAALVAVVIITALTLVGTNLTNIFTEIANKLKV